MKSRYTSQEKERILKRIAEMLEFGGHLKDVAIECGINGSTYLRWKKKINAANVIATQSKCYTSPHDKEVRLEA